MLLTGLILGKAMQEAIPVPIQFPSLFLKSILNEKIKIEDLKGYNTQIYNSLKKIKDCKDPDSLYLNFFMAEDTNEVELIEGGKEIFLNKDNRDLYIEKILRYYSWTRANYQNQLISSAFNRIVPKNLTSIYTAEQLAKVLYG